MPGILGYIGRFGESNSQPPLLERMANALEPESRFSKELFQEYGLGIGRVSLRITNPEKQPIWNRDRSLCLVMEGELFDYSADKRDLLNRGYRFQTESDGEFLLHLFEEYGEAALIKLNGAFAAAVWDVKQQKLSLLNDRLGLHPLYYTQTKEGLLFASGVRALLAESSMDRSIDQVAIAQFLTFDHMLGQRTLLRDVCLMPQGSILSYQEGRYSVQPYWRPKHPETYQLLSEAEWMEEFKARMQQAVDRQAQSALPSGVLLSGGLDSRALLASLGEAKGGSRFKTFTWGIPGCDDSRAAREVASIVGVENHFYELSPDWLLNLADEAVRITDGLASVTNLHALATLEQEAEHAQILFKGFLGDAMMGFALRPRLWADYDDETRIQAHIQTHRDQGVITFEFDEQKNLYTNSFREQVGRAVLETYRAGMDESDSTLLADQRIYFDYQQRVGRLTIKGVEVVRNQAVVRLPFADNDLVDLAISLPPGLRYERRLMRNAFIQAYPRLAQVPLTDTGLPMVACRRDIQIRAGRLARWHLNEAGLPVAKVKHRPYKDYNSWFRTVLRSWVEDTILSPCALERGYFNPEYVQEAVKDHMSGANNAGKIGALLSLELWHQQFID